MYYEGKGIDQANMTAAFQVRKIDGCYLHIYAPLDGLGGGVLYALLKWFSAASAQGSSHGYYYMGEMDTLSSSWHLPYTMRIH